MIIGEVLRRRTPRSLQGRFIFIVFPSSFRRMGFLPDKRIVCRSLMRVVPAYFGAIHHVLLLVPTDAMIIRSVCTLRPADQQGPNLALCVEHALSFGNLFSVSALRASVSVVCEVWSAVLLGCRGYD